MVATLLAAVGLGTSGFPPAKAQDGCGGEEGCGKTEINGASGDELRQEDQERKGEGDSKPSLENLGPEERVSLSLERGVAWLKRAQLVDGSFAPCHRGSEAAREYEEGDCDFSGPTSFALYTLAKCGVKKSDPTMRKGYRWLSDRYRKTQIWTNAVHLSGPEDTMGTARARKGTPA